MIDRATLHRIAPELTNQWAGPAMIEHARALGKHQSFLTGRSSVDVGEAFAWGVAFALRAERLRLASLVEHFARGVQLTGGAALARRIARTVRAARKAWSDAP